MHLPRGILAGLKKRLFKSRPEEPDIRLKVLNLTRHTVLANSMEVADSGPKRNKGLLGRDRLARGEGLWIIPCEAVHTFGMRFPIDLVYLDRKRKIRKLRCDVPPWRLSACLIARSVIELPAGTIRGTQTEVGDALEFLSAPLTSDGALPLE
jgi:hypothetical protein